MNNSFYWEDHWASMARFETFSVKQYKAEECDLPLLVIEEEDSDWDDNPKFEFFAKDRNKLLALKEAVDHALKEFEGEGE